MPDRERALRGERTDVGAVASFVGCVRGHTEEDDVSALTLGHDPGMAERIIEAIIVEAEARFAVQGALVIHCVGQLRPGERIVLVATLSPHRRDAFQACEFLMDCLKTEAPFWKKETTLRGARWVDARVADDAAARRGARIGECGGWAGRRRRRGLTRSGRPAHRRTKGADSRLFVPHSR